MKAIILSVVLIFLISSQVSAWSGPLQHPTLPYPKDPDKESVEKVRNAYKFMLKNLNFIEGRFFGPDYTNQSFGGAMPKAAKLIKRIQDADLWHLEVMLHDFKNPEICFSMTNQWENKLRIVVNSGKKDFVFNDFKSLVTTAATPSSEKEKN